MGAPAAPSPRTDDGRASAGPVRRARADDELPDDLRRGLRFVHKLEAQTRQDVFETAVSVIALLEELAERGAIDAASVARRTEEIRVQELDRLEEDAHVRILEKVDKYRLADLPDIDCVALFPLCQARCCTLHFALTKQDLDERVIRWDYRRPYLIRQRATDGYCVHNDRATGGCNAYAQRPGVCRTYDCRNDKRIWVDFEKRIPATRDPLAEAIELVKQGEWPPTG